MGRAQLILTSRGYIAIVKNAPNRGNKCRLASSSCFNYVLTHLLENMRQSQLLPEHSDSGESLWRYWGGIYIRVPFAGAVYRHVARGEYRALVLCNFRSQPQPGSEKLRIWAVTRETKMIIGCLKALKVYWRCQEFLADFIWYVPLSLFIRAPRTACSEAE